MISNAYHVTTADYLKCTTECGDKFSVIVYNYYPSKPGENYHQSAALFDEDNHLIGFTSSGYDKHSLPWDFSDQDYVIRALIADFLEAGEPEENWRDTYEGIEYHLSHKITYYA